MEIRELTCICCPMGCQMKVAMQDGEICRVSGNTCKRGEIYARKEVTAPTRIITSTVQVLYGERPVVSVKTQSDIPKEKVRICMQKLKDVKVEAPIRIGDVVVENIAETGVHVVATRSVERQKKGR